MLNNVMNNVSDLVSVKNEKGKLKSLSAILLNLLMLVIIISASMLFGEHLWNNFARRLIPGLGKARWYDVFVLSILVKFLIY